MPWVINNTIAPFDLTITLSGSRKLRLRLAPNGSDEIAAGDEAAIRANQYCKHLLRNKIISISKTKEAEKPIKTEVVVESKPEPEKKKRRKTSKKSFDKLDD
jgi:hypothetical protein